MKTETVFHGPEWPGLDLQSEAGAPVAMSTCREDGTLTGLRMPSTVNFAAGVPRGIDHVITEGADPVRLDFIGRSVYADDSLDGERRAAVNAEAAANVALKWDGTAFSMPGQGKVKGVQDGPIFWFIDTGA